MHKRKLIMIASAGRAAYQDERWPPAWGLLGAFFVSALMWWALLGGVRAMADAFMS